MGITGDSVYEKFGNEFLLIKFIESKMYCQFRFTPEMTFPETPSRLWKTEMWYILKVSNSKYIPALLKPVTVKNT